MAIEGKNFSLSKGDITLMTNSLSFDLKRQMLLTYDANKFQLQCFKNSLAVSVQGIIIYYGEGDGAWVQESTFDGPSFVENNNYLFVNFTALPDSNNFYTPSRTTYSFVDMHYYQALEVDLALWYLFGVIRVDPLFAGIFTTSTPVYLCGHSRGAAVLCKWSAMQHAGKTTPYTSNVVAIGANSPAGSNNGSGAYNAQNSLQETYSIISKIKVPTLITIGARDYTHLERSKAERYFRDLDTDKKVSLKLVNSGTGGHWPYATFAEFFNDTIAFGNAP